MINNEKIDQVLESIRLGYDKLEKIEKDLKEVREKRDTVFSK